MNREELIYEGRAYLESVKKLCETCDHFKIISNNKKCCSIKCSVYSFSIRDGQLIKPKCPIGIW